MKVLLIIAPGKLFLTLNSLTLPLGILYCASYLESKNIEVHVKDCLAEKLQDEDLLKLIEKEDYDIIGFNVLTDNRFASFKLAKKIKNKFSGIKIVFGGPHVTLDSINTLKNIPAIDYIVKGEGEITFYELIQAIKSDSSTAIENISGIYFRNNLNEVIFTGDRKLIKDLDTLPFPARHLVPIEKYINYSYIKGVGKLKTINLIISRGCPIGCNFCSNTELWGRSIRRRTNENVLKEIEFLKNEYDIQCFIFSDDTLNFYKDKLIDLCEKIINKNLNIYWSCALRAENFDEDLISLMKKAGCFRIGYGVESGNQEILATVVKKDIDLNKVKEFSELLNKYDIENWPNFIISFPDESYDQACETLEFLKALNADQPILNVCRIYPGTDVERKAYEKKIIPEDFSWTDETYIKTEAETLPGLIGEVPLYIEKLTWEQISFLLFEWAKLTDFNIWQAGWESLKKIRNLNDAKRLFKIGMTFLKTKITK